MKFQGLRSLGIVACTVSALFSTSCGGNGEGREPGEPGVIREQVAAAPAITWFRWSKGEPAKRMERVSTHVCGLGMVRGQLAADTQVFIRQGTGFFELLGIHPGSNFLQLDGVCVPLSAFKLPSGGAVTNGVQFHLTTAAHNTTVSKNMTAGSAAILTQVRGAFNGRPEQSWVTYGNLVPTLNAKNGTASGTHGTSATALLFGVAPIYTHSIDAPSLGVDGSDVFITDCPFGLSCCDASRLDNSFCYLSSVSGDFNGAEEWVQVFPDWARGTWFFNVNAGHSGSVYASVHCLRYDQNPSIPIIR